MSFLSAIGDILKAPAIGTAFKVAGELGSSYLSSKSARSNLATQLAWERERATNAHQWEVEDLRKAGLNPILSATGGSGASTSAITPQMPDFSGVSRAGSALSEYLNLSNQVNALKIQDATEKQIKAETTKTEADTAVSKSKEFLNKVEAAFKAVQSKVSAKEAERLDALITQLKWEISHYKEGNFAGRAAEDIKRYFGNTIEGRIMMLLLGIQQDDYPDIKPKPTLSGGN